ncbi:MAG: Na+-transporting NADH:ubiquinone oxidoreductase subunit C [Candidatus Marinamargulisbacteria bacterium]|jgi:Na+-transporting NADH:ubiquinone oxidoreductase subunit C
MSSSTKSFVFAAVLCLVCGLLLTGASEGLRERQGENVKLDKQKNILKSLGLLSDSQELTRTEIISLFESKIKSAQVDASGQFVDHGGAPLYVLREGNQIAGYVVPFEAYGLWSLVKGFISIQGDGETVQGFTVYSHGETPGLGGECEKPWFQDQFRGKKILNRAGEFVSVGVVKGKVSDVIAEDDQINYVDGMSGATITSKGIERDLKKTLGAYEPFSKRFRKK